MYEYFFIYKIKNILSTGTHQPAARALHNVCEYARFLVFVELLVIKTQCTVVPSVIPSPIWVLMVAQVSMVGKGRALATSRAPQSTILLHF